MPGVFLIAYSAKQKLYSATFDGTQISDTGPLSAGALQGVNRFEIYESGSSVIAYNLTARSVKSIKKKSDSLEFDFLTRCFLTSGTGNGAGSTSNDAPVFLRLSVIGQQLKVEKASLFDKDGKNVPASISDLSNVAFNPHSDSAFFQTFSSSSALRCTPWTIGLSTATSIRAD